MLSGNFLDLIKGEFEDISLKVKRDRNFQDVREILVRQIREEQEKHKMREEEKRNQIEMPGKKPTSGDDMTL